MDAGRVLLNHARIIDGLGGAPVDDGAVLIEGDTIRWAGPSAQAPSAATVVDLDGRTLCPGFVDCHVHFVLPGRKGSVVAGLQQHTSYRMLAVLERLRVTLQAGVTTARDLMGLDAGFRQAVDERLVAGPRLRVAVSMLGQTAGHSDFSMPSGLDPFPHAVALPGAPGSLVDTTDDMRKAVRQLIGSGADCVKIASSGGVASPHDDPDWLGTRPELIRAAVEEANAYGGVPVAVHAIGRPGIEAAVEAGVTSIEHGYGLDDQLRTQMVEQGQYLVPTLLETMQDLDPVAVSPAAYEKSRKWHAVAHEAFGASATSGVRLAMGTDSGLSPDHGTNLRELGLMVRFGGLEPMQAIVAGTSNGAELCGVGDLVGTVESGKLADLVVLGVDPLTDIDALGEATNVELVLKGGRVAVDRAALLPGGTFPSLVER